MRPTPSILVALCLAATSAGCAPAPRTVAVDCRSEPSSAAGPTETLAVDVHIDHRLPGAAPRLLVRVDPLSEPGAVVFESGTPPTAAAASVALTTSGTFQGCIATAPSSFELRAPEAPVGRVWLRVSSNVPVAARLRVGGVEGEAAVTVQPGASGRATLTRAAVRPGS